MSSKLYSRSGVFAWSPRGIQAKGLIVADFAQFFDPNAASVEQKIDFLSSQEIYEKANLIPNVSLPTNYRFNELAWTSMCSDVHPSGILAGGTEDGTVVFFDAEKFINSHKLEILSARKDHHGHVLTIDVSRDGRWMASGGGAGQILLWDCANLKTPFSPGTPNFQDQVKLLRWNHKNESVFASISSRRVSFWDLRRNGSPVLEFAEIPGCDWSSLCWNPSDASQLIVASQSQQASVVQKWDSRFTQTPVKEYRHHNNGVTSLDWNRSDDRLLISSGCDGQVIIWNHETSEVLGGVGSLTGDWIRSVKWNTEEPAQFAIQYFQNPVQLSSLTSLGAPQPGAEVLAARVTDQFVPAWHRAPLIGSSVSLGGRLATFWKSYDVMTQQFQHNVEVETIALHEDIGAEDVSQYLHIKDDKRNLGWYLHERAHSQTTDGSEDAELQKQVWLILLALQEGAGRSKMLRHLGLVEAEEDEVFSNQNPTTATSHSTTQPTTSTADRSARSTSIVSGTDTDIDVPEISIIEKCAEVNWGALDQSGWELLLNTMRQDHLAVIRVLMSSNQHVAAMMYAAQHDTEHLCMIMEDYNKKTNNSNPLAPLMLALSSSASAHGTESNSSKQATEETIRRIESIAQSFPYDKWRELLGLMIAHETNTEDIRLAAKIIGNKWMNQGRSLRACIAFLIGGDVENLLAANTSFSKVDRLKQALILHQLSKASSYANGLEKLMIEFANQLLVQGAGSTAWNLVKWCQNGSAEMQELQWTCYNVAGGRDCTGDQPPVNPYCVSQPRQQQPQMPTEPIRQYQQHPSVLAPPSRDNGFNPYNPAYSHAPPPADDYVNNRRNSNIAPMPPSSTFYQTPSWNHKPLQPPSMPPNMPPPKPAAPMTPGWNDPPPMKPAQPTQPKQNVMEINWKPIETAPVPGGMMRQPMNGFAGTTGYQNGISSGVQSMTIQNPPSATSSAYPSPSAYQPRPSSVASNVAPPPIQLSPEDEKIVEPINVLAQFIVENAINQAKKGKANDLKARIQAELSPRLAANRLSMETKQHLTHLAYFVSMRQIREAQAVVAQMARNSSDFTEISSFLPALKSLLSLALQ